MPRFFCTRDQIQEDVILITGPDVNHIKNVLRKKPGDVLEVCDGEGRVFDTEICETTAEEITLKILEEKTSLHELPARITLYQGLPKQDKMELILQKSAELGVFRLVPVEMVRCVAKWDRKKEEARLRRYSAIAESAAKQSGRDRIPEVARAMSLKEALKEAKANLAVILLPYENAGDMGNTRQVFEDLKGREHIAVFIGPEGGFEESEVEEALASGAKVITLGPRILRTETAGPAVLAMLNYVLN